MNYTCRHICTLFIVIIFAIKPVIPLVVVTNNLPVKAQEVQSENPEEEKNTEEASSFTIKAEPASLSAFSYLFLSPLNNTAVQYKTHQYTLLKAFSPVSTPPPWLKLS